MAEPITRSDSAPLRAVPARSASRLDTEPHNSTRAFRVIRSEVDNPLILRQETHWLTVQSAQKVAALAVKLGPAEAWKRAERLGLLKLDTRPVVAQRVPEPPDPRREAWLAELELQTRLIRAQRAAHLRELAKRETRTTEPKILAVDGTSRQKRITAWRKSGLVARDTRGAAATHVGDTGWHESRAKGVEDCFDRVEHCGEDLRVRMACGSCGKDHFIPVGCANRFFCIKCRVQRSAKLRSDFEMKRAGLIWRAQLAGLTERWRGKNRFGEKLLTLTMPKADNDGQSLSVRRRIQAVKAAAPIFERALRAHYAEQLAELQARKRGAGPVHIDGELLEFALRFVHYVRVLEWTPGADKLGHPHLHFWLFAPYIEKDTLRRMWDSALHRACPELEPGGFVDVRAVHQGDVDDGHGGKSSVASELIKYLVKDWHKGGCLVDAETFAQVYAELSICRIRQSSKGLGDFAAAKETVCPTCNSGLLNIYLEPLPGGRLDPLLDRVARPKPSDETVGPLKAASGRVGLIDEPDLSFYPVDLDKAAERWWDSDVGWHLKKMSAAIRKRIGLPPPTPPAGTQEKLFE